MTSLIGQTASHFKILSKLGEGGMGVVYKAHDTILDRDVALKFLPHHVTTDPAEKERFYHEAKAAAALTHSNIAVVHEIGEHDGQVFIAMELVQGQTLKQLAGSDKLPVMKVLEIAAQVCDGLAAAHEKGIVHRDIKSDNIMVTPKGQAKIMDFGLAKLKGGTRLTKAGSTLGTAAYMSPEQAQGEEVDHRSDIFSLGVVLYELFTGHLPFRGEHDAALLYALVNEEPQPIARFNEEVTLETEHIVAKALAKDKQERYQHVDEMIADLRRIQHTLSGSGTQALKKSRRIWIIGAAFVVFAVTGIYLFYPKSVPISVNAKSVAVLPFKNLSDSKEDEYFSDGITDDIIAQLSKITDLKVISRTSVMQYKGVSKNVREIGRELDVGTVLEGSVRRAGNQVRIVAQLIDASNEGHLWAETYDKEMTQIFAIQSVVAQRIATALQARLSPAEKGRIEKKQTGNTGAYQLYLKGRFYWNKRRLDEIETAIEFFKQAIGKDPEYALAYAGLASAYVLGPSYGIPVGEWYTNAQNAAVKALEIDSTLGEAHTVLGEIAQDHYFDWADAEKHFRRAIELDPGYPTTHQWYSCSLSFLGRFDEDLSEAKRAEELDPLSLVINMNLGDVLYVMRQYDRAIEQYKNTLALDQMFPWPHSGLASVYEVQGKFDESIAEYQKAKSLGGNIPYTLVPLGWAYARAGRKADALHVLQELLQLAQHGNSVSYGIAFLCYELGDKDKAFEWFDKAYQDRDIWLESLGTDPLWDDLRADPRCIALLKKMGLRK